MSLGQMCILDLFMGGAEDISFIMGWRIYRDIWVDKHGN